MTNLADTLDAQAVEADEFVRRMIDARRAVAAAQAAEAAVLASASSWAQRIAGAISRRAARDTDMTVRDLSAQIGAGVRLSDRTVQAQMSDASILLERFPATFEAWSAGRIDRAHMVVITDAGLPVSDDAARAWFETEALARATVLTPAQLRPVARSLAEHVHPESLEDRHVRARIRRQVRVSDLDDGMARLILDAAAPIVYGIEDRLTRMARSIIESAERGTRSESSDCDPDAGAPDCEAPSSGPALITESSRTDAASSEPRTMAELRADVMADLLLAAAPVAHGEGDALASIRGHVQVSVPVLTVLGESREPAILAGHGPIPIDLATQLCGTASGWDRVMTHPTTGAPLAVDRYRPSKELRRFLRVRDEHCRFPGCRQPIWRCDADHTIDYALGGSTSAGNLADLCRRHHSLKGETAWTVRQLGQGRLRWTSPAGRTYLDDPSPMVRFVPADPAPL